MSLCLFFFNDTATTEIYTLSLHDALPIFSIFSVDLTDRSSMILASWDALVTLKTGSSDRKSTRLNSSHQIISYAVFCLKKKKQAIVYSRITSLYLGHLAQSILLVSSRPLP